MDPRPAGPLRDYPPDYNRYEMEYGPFNFDSYDDEDYYFDCDGAYGLRGGKEATSAVHKTLYEFRSAARRIAKATGQDPNHCDHLIEVPADAPQPEDIYGYQALRWIFGSEQAARVSAGRRPIGRRRLSRPPAPAPRRPGATH